MTKVMQDECADEINRRIDVEVSVIGSNMISGASGRIIRSVVENASDVNTEVDESRQDMYLPIEIKEFSYIRCRLLNHMSKEPIKYKYETVVGRPFLVLKISPQ